MFKKIKVFAYLALQHTAILASCSKPNVFHSQVITFIDPNGTLCTVHYLSLNDSKKKIVLITDSRKEVGWNVNKNGGTSLVLGKNRIDFNGRKYNAVTIRGEKIDYFNLDSKNMLNYQKIWRESGK